MVPFGDDHQHVGAGGDVVGIVLELDAAQQLAGLVGAFGIERLHRVASRLQGRRDVQRGRATAPIRSRISDSRLSKARSSEALGERPGRLPEFQAVVAEEEARVGFAVERVARELGQASHAQARELRQQLKKRRPGSGRLQVMVDDRA